MKGRRGRSIETLSLELKAAYTQRETWLSYDTGISMDQTIQDMAKVIPSSMPHSKARHELEAKLREALSRPQRDTKKSSTRAVSHASNRTKELFGQAFAKTYPSTLESGELSLSTFNKEGD